MYVTVLTEKLLCRNKRQKNAFTNINICKTCALHALHFYSISEESENDVNKHLTFWLIIEIYKTNVFGVSQIYLILS